ncbi:MAG: hypothetical protein AAB551_03345 [Patescibacteria group bacterium]
MTDQIVQQSDLKTLMTNSPSLQMLPQEQLEKLLASVDTLDPALQNQVMQALAKEQADLAQLKSEYDTQARALFDEYMTTMKEKEIMMIRGFQQELEAADKTEESKILDSLLQQLDTL